VIFKLCSCIILAHPEIRYHVSGSIAIKLHGQKVIPNYWDTRVKFFVESICDFLCDIAHNVGMMSGEECRAKARQSLEFAKHLPGAEMQAEWRTMAREWLRLGLMADYQDRMQCD
jgi:hypothetical protein